METSPPGVETGPSRSHPLRLVLACFALALGGMLLGGIVLFVGAFFVLIPLGIEPSGPALLVLSLVSLQGIAFPGIAAAYFALKGRSLRAFVPASVPSAREVGIVLVAWLGTFVLVGIGATVVTTLAGSPPAENAAGQTAIENPEFIPVLVVLVFLLIGPGEELLFRGVIQGLLRERFGPAAAILLATATFAPIHIFALVGSLQAAAVTITILAIPSVVFGTVYELTDNIVVPTLVHGLFNATLFASVYVTATSGGM